MKDIKTILKVSLLATASFALVACSDSTTDKAATGGTTGGSGGATGGTTNPGNASAETTATALADGLESAAFVTEGSKFDPSPLKVGEGKYQIGTKELAGLAVLRSSEDFKLSTSLTAPKASNLNAMASSGEASKLNLDHARVFIAEEGDFDTDKPTMVEVDGKRTDKVLKRNGEWRKPGAFDGSGFQTSVKKTDGLHFHAIGMHDAVNSGEDVSGFNASAEMSIGILNLAGKTSWFNGLASTNKTIQTKYLYLDGRAEVHLKGSVTAAATKKKSDKSQATHKPTSTEDPVKLWAEEANLTFKSLPADGDTKAGFDALNESTVHAMQMFGIKHYVPVKAGQALPAFWVDGELGANVELNSGALLMTLNPGHVEIADAAGKVPTEPAHAAAKLDKAAKPAKGDAAKNMKAAASTTTKVKKDPQEKLSKKSVDRGAPYMFIAKDKDGNPADKFQYVHDVTADDATIRFNPATPMVGRDWSVTEKTVFHVVADSKYFLHIEPHGSNDNSTKLYDAMVTENSFTALMDAHDEHQKAKAAKKELDATKKPEKAGDKGVQKKKPTTVDGAVKKTTAKATGGKTHLSTNLPYAAYLRSLTFNGDASKIFEFSGANPSELEIIPDHEGDHLAEGTYVLPLIFIAQEPAAASASGAKDGTKKGKKKADASTAVEAHAPAGDTVLIFERTDKVYPSHKIKSARVQLIHDEVGHDMALVLEVKDSTLETYAATALHSALKGSIRKNVFDAAVISLDAAQLSAKAFGDVSSLKAQAAGARFNLARHTLANTGFASESSSFGNSLASASSFKLGDSFRLAISNASDSNAKVNGFALAHGFGKAVAMFTAQAATTGAKTDKVSFSGAQFDVNAAVGTSFTVAGLSVTPMASVGFTTFAADGYNSAVKLGSGVAHVDVDNATFNAVNADLGVQFALNAPKALVSSSATFGVQGQYANGMFDMKVNGNSFDVKHDLNGFTPYAQFHLNLGDVDTSLNVNSRAVGFSFNFAN